MNNTAIAWLSAGAVVVVTALLFTAIGPERTSDNRVRTKPALETENKSTSAFSDLPENGMKTEGAEPEKNTSSQPLAAYSGAESWYRMPEKVRTRWLEFEEFSPGNSFNPFPGTEKPADKKLKRRHEKIDRINRTRYKLSRGYEISDAEKLELEKFKRSEINDKIDLLRFALLKDSSLSRSERQAMQYEIKNLRNRLQNL